ncbi:MAG TPA: transposase [Candidatus Angelobacter sp.]
MSIAYKGAGSRGPWYRLLTTIVYPQKAPARELAALYQQRWEMENTVDELKVHLRGPQVLLRSQTPDLVRQELYGFLMFHFAVRSFMHEAAWSVQNPGSDQIQFSTQRHHNLRPGAERP